jgi:hypothetical protein
MLTPLLWTLLATAPVRQDHHEVDQDDHVHDHDAGAQDDHLHDPEHDHPLEVDPAHDPAFGGVVDLFATSRDRSEGSDDLDLTLRSFELTAGTWVAPDTWSWAVLHADEEEVVLEEAAVELVEPYEGSTLHAGRFYVDFGRQMQLHLHELPFPERPAVLREYLGEELAGTGLQLDQRLGEDLVFSLGLFDSLLDPHEHGEGHEHDEEESAVATGTGSDSLDLTLRLRGAVHDVGPGDLDWGVSLREAPDVTFELESNGFERTDLSNRVVGIDVSWASDGWTLGAEVLRFSGDIGAEVDDGGTPNLSDDDTLLVLDDDVTGYYAWIERALDEQDALGLLVSGFEHPEAGRPEDTELTLYYTRQLSRASRLRFAVSNLDTDEGGDETSFLVQFTNFFGAHVHRKSGHPRHGS